jgi:hypothetical protein
MPVDSFCQVGMLCLVPSKGHTFQRDTISVFTVCLSTGYVLVINRPNHGPGVDVDQGTAGARIAMTVAHAPWVACTPAAMILWGTMLMSPYICLHTYTYIYRNILTYTVFHT